MEKKFLPARAAGIAGIIFVVAAAVPGFASGSPPDPSDPAAKFLSYYHDNRSALITAALLGMIGTFFAFFFFAKLISALRRADGETGALTLVAVVSIAVVATMAAIGGILSATAAFRLGGAEHIDAVTLVAFNDAASITFALLGVPLAAFFASQGLLMMGTRLLPAWLAVLTLVMAALEFVGSFTVLSTTGFFSPGGPAGLFLGLLPLAIVVLSTSIVMLVRPAPFDGVASAAGTAGAVPAAAG